MLCTWTTGKAGKRGRGGGRGVAFSFLTMIQEEKDGFYRKRIIYRESRKSILSLTK